MSETVIYTDGSSLKNPGPSGWGCIIIEKYDNKNYEITLSGNEKKSTNNRMELLAVIEGIRFTDNKDIKIFSDSKLVINCAKGLWKRKKNLDLWERYDKVIKNKNINYTWVKGHNGDRYNEKVDKIAREEAKNIFTSLKKNY